ncbi:NRDE family protein [Oligella urethralis]|uniref:NRDE family protein n=1 Tax=Oligella urethralis TaxID=90245 RepID=UPI0003601DC7|nr:NRDE family protein [Oligella urethralis]SUA68687.1 Uncharacterized conserved protein [Oligella urethralis]
MCIAYLRFQPEQEIALFIAANRDEFHRRPTAYADIWPDHDTIIAGRDLEAGGTWLGMNRQGGAALITNIRHPMALKSTATSRGALVLNALRHHAADPAHWHDADPLAQWLQKQGPLDSYNGFNLIFGDAKALYYLSNYALIAADTCSHKQHLHPLKAGSYTLSNANLYTPWPKTEALGKSLAQVDVSALRPHDFHEPQSSFVRDFTGEVFARLADTQQAAPERLPQTGITKELEQLLSSPFIINPDYGTRSSSIVLIFKDGSSFLAERSFDPQAHIIQQRYFFQRQGEIVCGH